MTPVGKRIMEKRIELGMSQDELAQKVGYKDRSSIAKIESGERDIRQAKVIAFAEALHTTPQWLMGYDAQNHEKSNITAVSSEPIPEDPKLSKAVALISSLNDIGQDVAIQRLEELNEIGKYKADDQSDGSSSILFILITAVFMSLLHLIG